MGAPTNTDIYREIKDIKKDGQEMREMIREHDIRIRPLENWKIAYEAAVKALEGAPTSRNTNTLNKDFVNIVLKFITLLTALVGLTYLIVDKVLK